MISTSERKRVQGSAGTIIRNNVLLDPDESAEFKGELWYGTPTTLGSAQKMHRDPHVRRCHESYVNPIRRAMLDMEAGAEEPRAREAARFAYWALFEQLDWDNFVRQSMLEKRDGFAIFELTDDVCDLPEGKFPLHPGRGQGVTFTGFHHRPAWSVTAWEPRADDGTKLAAVIQHPPSSGAACPRIDGDRVLRFSCDQEGANFAGISWWRSVAGDWKVKRLLKVLIAIKHERQGLGTPAIELPPDATDDDKEKAEEILAFMNAHEKGFIVLPNGFKFSWIAGGQTTNMEEGLAYCDRAIAFGFGASFLMLGAQGAGPGSYALSSTLDGQHELAVETAANERLLRVWRGSEGWSPLRRLIDLNYGADVALPKPVLRDLPTRDWASALPIVATLIEKKAIRVDAPLRGFIRAVMTLPKEDPSTFEAEPAPLLPPPIAPAPAPEAPRPA